MRNTLTLLFSVMALSIWAQNTDHRFFQSAQPMDIPALRDAIQAVVDVAPDAEVFFSDDHSLLQVKGGAQVSDADLREALAGAGILLLPGTPALATAHGQDTRQDGRPLYVLTGDPAGDRARYEAAVEQWNELNPDAPLSVPPTDPQH
jgi:hypothetical protein